MGTEEQSERTVAAEVDAMLDAWRSKIVTVVLAVAVVAMLPALTAVLTGRIFQLVWPLRVVCVLLYLAVATAAWRTRWSLACRAAILLAAVAATGIMQLMVTQLVGSGRLSFVTLPLIALILVGPRTGWIMVALSIGLYSGGAWLCQTDVLADWRATEVAAVGPSYWLLQGLRLGGVQVVLMVLLSQFHKLQRRTMIAERTALRKLEAETADRRRLEIEVAHVGEDERRRLGAELHDGLCQHLTATLLNCTALENRQSAAGARDVTEISCIRESIAQSIDMAYDVAQGLCPVDMAPDGLTAALEGLCRAARERRGLACEIHADKNAAVINPDHALQLYRIAGEALTNAAKHAECARVVVRVARQQSEFVLSVTDDGKGIPRETNEGLGRRIMAYRAGLIGGTLTVSGVPGQGTTVTCRIPDREDAA